MLPSSVVSSPTQFAPVAYSVIAVFLWGGADFAGGYGSRRANAFVLTAFSHFCALAFMLVIALGQHGEFPSRTSILWAMAAGAVGGFSLAIFYRALASGQMGLTAPIGALLGAAIPALADIAMEGAPSRWTIAGFALAILAIWLITRPDPQAENDDSGHPRGAAMAALAGVGFAGFYLCIHQASGSPTWIAAMSRIGSCAATAVAVVATRAPLCARPSTRRSWDGRRMPGYHRQRPVHLRQPARTLGRGSRDYFALSGGDRAASPRAVERTFQPLEIHRSFSRASGRTADFGGIGLDQKGPIRENPCQSVGDTASIATCPCCKSAT